MHDPGRIYEPGARDLSLSDIAAFFGRQWRFIVAVTLGIVALTGILVLLLLPRRYEAVATLVVVPPKPASQLRTTTLTAQGYQQLLESDAAIDETERRLKAAGVLAAEDELRLGRELESRIPVAGRADEAPVLLAVARWPAPEAAEAIANTWAEALFVQTALLIDNDTSPEAPAVVEQFEARSDGLARLEDERFRAAGDRRRQDSALVEKWEGRILAHRNETSDLLGADAAETSRLVESFRSETGFEAAERRLEALRRAYADLQIERIGVESRLQQKQLELRALEEQVRATPPRLELRRSMVDEAPSSTPAGSRKDARSSQLPQPDLVTEVLNPVHTTMASHRSEAEAAVSALLPRASQLAKNLAALEEDLQQAADQVGAKSAELEALKQRRIAGRQRLRQSRRAGRAALERRQAVEVSAAQDTWATRRMQLDRKIDVERNLVAELAQQYKEAIIASVGEEFGNVRLGPPAVAPPRPMPRDLALKLALAASLGSVLALLVALFRDSLSAAQPPAAPSDPATNPVRRTA